LEIKEVNSALENTGCYIYFSQNWGNILKTKRLAVAFFYDKHGIVDEYMTYLVKSLKPFVEKTIFVSNGPLSKESETAVQDVAENVLIRENTGFDVWAYKEALERVGFEELKKYDELILYNYTFYGPIFPFSEMFTEMEKRICDFWGITSHQSMKPNPFTGKGVLPFHLNSHFIAIRKPMLSSLAFQNYWNTMPEIESYTDSVLKHESRFTKHFIDLGYKTSSYVDNKDYSTEYPVVMEVHETIANRCPIVKRRNFFHEHAFFEENATDFPLALQILRQTSKYDERLIWQNALRSAELRVMNVNAALMTILPNGSSNGKINPNKFGKVAACAHIYYIEMLEEILDKTKNIPVPYDFIATTDTKEKAAKIRTMATGRSGIKRVIVRTVTENRGRDLSALLITCRDLFLNGDYDLVCRIHSKKTPQISRNKGNIFKRHMFENLLSSKGYVTNVLELLTKRPWIGLAIPPIVHISVATIGSSWFSNRGKTAEVAELLNLRVNFDSDTPVAPYGTMFWFRPIALRKLFEHKWKWSDFNTEPNHVDGGLAHALERLIAYVAQDASFTTEHIATAHSAAQNYTVLEYKLDKLISKLPPNSVRVHAHSLENWKNAGYPLYGYTVDAHSTVGNWLHRFRVSLYPASNMIKDPIKKFFGRL
jgi:lipopolysaccharide biosynthesis protein